MTTQAWFKYDLDENEITEIKKFCDSVDYCAIEQLPGWTGMFYNTRIRYFCMKDESGIKSFCQIHESFRTANIHYGPVCSDRDLMIESLEKIIKFYKNSGYFYLGIQMYNKSGFDTDYIEYAMNKKYHIRYFFNSENTKSSIEINLDDSLEDIWKKLRDGHKRNIKKSEKLGTTIETVINPEDLASFLEVYIKMCKIRHISDSEISEKNIVEIFNFLENNNRGHFYLIKDSSGIVLGGVIIVNQGISVRYLKGASDPERKEIPVLHNLLYHAVTMAKKNNFKYFDFWGYNHFVDETDQIYNINYFKKGFGGYYTFFAKKMNIDLVPHGYRIYKSILLAKKMAHKILS
jgi:lipid II:glycine glycyltransferase (peptidoglycan interpeptide bridge formation enzyme)